MIFFEFAKRNIRLHLFRSLLAVLGIVIGVASIASMGVLGNSLVLSVSDSISTVGDTIVVSPHAGGGGFGAGVSNQKISERDLESITRAAAPNPAIPVFSGGDRMKIGSEDAAGAIYGLRDEDMPLLLEIDKGAFIRGSSGALVGAKFAEEYDLIVGNRITVGENMSLRVGGILKERGIGFDINPDFGIVVSDKWYKDAYGQEDYDMVIVKVKDLSKIDGVKEAIETRLNRREEVVNVLDTRRILEGIMTAFGSISAFVTAIGGISLVVAGVSILNIMMMSVTERIREIGIMRSIGTQKSEVLRMFLYEALILGLIGSVLGGVAAVAGGFIVSAMLLQTTKYLFVLSNVVPVLIGMGFGIGTSLVCGIYPAWKAANLNPIDALRHE